MEPLQAITSCDKCPMMGQGNKCSIDSEIIPVDSLGIDCECVKLTALFSEPAVVPQFSPFLIPAEAIEAAAF